MTTVPQTPPPPPPAISIPAPVPGGAPSLDGGWLGRNQVLLDLSTIDLTACRFTKEFIGTMNPHRHAMALLDKVVWSLDDFTLGVAKWSVRPDEFWVPGHFPGKPMLPGVLQLEAGAQLAVFLYNIRQPRPVLCAFTRVDNCSFRGQVAPGDDLYIVCREIKRNSRRFISAAQGIVNGKIAFEAQIEGIRIGDAF